MIQLNTKIAKILNTLNLTRRNVLKRQQTDILIGNDAQTLFAVSFFFHNGDQKKRGCVNKINSIMGTLISVLLLRVFQFYLIQVLISW